MSDANPTQAAVSGSVGVLPLLATEERIGLLGDVHGVVGDILAAAAFFADNDVRVVIQLGDFGLPWPGSNWGSDVAKLTGRFTDLDVTFLVVDGNHDWHPRLLQLPIAEDGIRWLSPRIGFFPRAFRGELAGGRTFAVMGGAGSIDLDSRTEGTSWWREEIPTDAELASLGRDPVDILFGHDAPMDVLSLDRMLAENDAAFHGSPIGVGQARRGRLRFQEAVERTSPAATFGAHYHCFVYEKVGAISGLHGFGRYVTVLDMAGHRDGVSRAILAPRSGELGFFTSMSVEVSPPEQVTDLTKQEDGIWRVDTIGSTHILDLDTMHCTRIPGPEAEHAITDGTFRLTSIERARIGRSGFWWMDGNEYEDFWHRTSVIRHLTRISREQADNLIKGAGQ